MITEVFSPQTQALAGAVFNTISQLGTSMGIAVMAVIAQSFTDNSLANGTDLPQAYLAGYRAVFWACFVLMMLAADMGYWGLRGVGKLGTRKD